MPSLSTSSARFRHTGLPASGSKVSETVMSFSESPNSSVLPESETPTSVDAVTTAT